MSRSDRARKREPGWLAGAFRAEALAGHALTNTLRLASLAVIAGLILYISEPPDVYVFLAILALFAALGTASYVCDLRFGLGWPTFAFVGLDFVLLTLTITVVAPALEPEWPAQMVLRNGGIVYYYLLVTVVAFSHSAPLVLWAGVSAALTWSAGNVWLLTQPGATTKLDHPGGQTAAEHMADHLVAGFIDIDRWLQQVVVLLLVTGTLAAVARRSRRLVVGQAGAARERANLARYFSPNVVDELAGRDQPLGATQRREVAVLFADMASFTAMAESMAPEQVMQLLRDFHGRMEEQVFRHGGTLEKFIGDAMLAIFGAPVQGEHDAADALACMRDMLASLAAWNGERRAAGEPEIRIGVGVHYGPAVFGDIGSQRNMAFAVIGDTVNTASRLQALTRELDCQAVVSAAAVGAAGGEPGDLQPAPAQQLRGRRDAIAVWTLKD